MTEDTKKAVEIISPLAKELGITVEATDSILWMNDQEIGIACNSSYATLMEAVGWIFLEEYVKNFRYMDLDPIEVKDCIQRYWIKNPKSEGTFTMRSQRG